MFPQIKYQIAPIPFIFFFIVSQVYKLLDILHIWEALELYHSPHLYVNLMNSLNLVQIGQSAF